MTYPHRKTNIAFDRVISKAYWTWRKNPALMIPTLLYSSISVLSQSIVVIFGTSLLIQLESEGVVSQIASAVSSGNLGTIGQIFLASGVLYPMIEYLGAAFVISAIVSILASGLVYSSEFNSYVLALGGERVGISAVLNNLKTKWKKMAITLLLTDLLTLIPVGALSLLGLLPIFLGGANASSLLEFTALFIFGSLMSALLYFFFMYSLVSVAVDNASGISAISKSLRIARENFGVSFTYAIVSLLSTALISLVAASAGTIGVPLSSLGEIVITLLLVPVLHMTKTSIYVQARTQKVIEFEVYGTTSSTKDLFGGPFFRFALKKLRRGISELRTFALGYRNFAYHAASALSFGIGILVGGFVGTHGLDNAILALGYTPGVINPTLLKDVPLTAGFDIFFHNWLVSLSTALSGLWLVAPSPVALAFNGIILGAVYYLTPNFSMFAAAIFPHGVIEIPALVLAGSAGIRLGISFISTFGKKADSPEEKRFHNIFSETVYVVIGLALLFLVAGIIEGNLTPVIMRMYGWK